MTEKTENIKTIKKNSPPNARKKGIESIIFGVILVLLFGFIYSYTKGGFNGLGFLLVGIPFIYGEYIIIFGLHSLATGKFNRVTKPESRNQGDWRRS